MTLSNALPLNMFRGSRLDKSLDLNLASRDLNKVGYFFPKGCYATPPTGKKYPTRSGRDLNIF